MTIKKYAGDKITGLSSDTKPTNVPEGATFHELDTGKVYYRYSSAWTEIDNTKANNAYNQANTSLTVASAAFDKANAANFMPVGNTMSNGYFTVRSTANKLNFLPGTNITVNVDNDATLNTSNITVAANLTVRSANIVNVTVSATAPTNNVAGDIWIDIS